MIEKSVCIFYQKDSAPHAMTLMKEIEFMIGLFTVTIGMQSIIPEHAFISKTSLSCERTLYCMYSSRLHAIVHYSTKDSKDKLIHIVLSYKIS